MAAHRKYLMASICGLAALIGGPAPALAGPHLVPDEAALTEYVPLLPSAEGPVLATPGAGPPTTPPEQALPASVDGELSRLPADRASALRRLAADPSLGAPRHGATPVGAASAAQQAAGAAVAARRTSALSAVVDAVDAAPTSAILLALLLAFVLLAAAIARLVGRLAR